MDLAHRLCDLLQDQVAELLALGELRRLHRGDHADHDERDQRYVFDRPLTTLASQPRRPSSSVHVDPPVVVVVDEVCAATRTAPDAVAKGLKPNVTKSGPPRKAGL